MSDPTETMRKELVAEINSNPGERESLEAIHGQVWNTKELGEDFVVESFMAPFILARRKSTGEVGTLMFQHEPRFYFKFEPDKR